MSFKEYIDKNKRRFKIAGATITGGILGGISVGGTSSVILGAYAGNKAANYVLDSKGNNKYI